MIDAIKSEFKKVFTIRSTYVIFAVMLVLLGFFGFYVGGWHTTGIDLLNKLRYFRIAQQSISFLAIFPALIALLLYTHEIRYSTFAYSLTLNNSRSKVLAAKIIVITVISVIAIAIVGSAAPLLAYWGVHAHHLNLVHQSFFYDRLIWSGLVYGWGYGMIGLVLGALIRNQIGAIVTLFVVPHTVEGLLSIWLKNNVVYLPFSALDTMLGVGVASNQGPSSGPIISPIHAMYVFLAYLLFAWILAWYLFLTKDAT